MKYLLILILSLPAFSARIDPNNPCWPEVCPTGSHSDAVKKSKKNDKKKKVPAPKKADKKN